jgi:dipeptidyl aminopeptidase/acylaminoacyl peptidase
LPAAGQDRRDGTIIRNEPFSMRPLTYAQDMEFGKSFYERESNVAQSRGLSAVPYQQIVRETEEEWNATRTHEGFDCRSIRYMSDGLEINGLLYKPVATVGRLLPIVILNRGGNRDFGAWFSWYFAKRAFPFAKAGFVVLASQYRGGGGSQGKDELGGADVNDVFNLIEAAKSLDYADMNNVFMHGVSRGGMMTYLSIRRKAPIRAAVVLSGASDAMQVIKDRPEMREEFIATVPDFAQHEEESLRHRSAIIWAAEITVPVLLLHGTADWRVDASDALRFAQELQRLNKNYQLMMFSNDGHGLPANQRTADQAAIDWFKKHMQPGATAQ